MFKVDLEKESEGEVVNTFAGFWVDGAVRKPEDKHADSSGWVITRHKETGELDKWDITDVEDVDYWLDTTPRESLTPEELFSVLKVIWPNLQYVDLATDGGWCVASDQANNETAIQWNGLERYPPPVEPQWLRVTRENVGQHLFRECRFRDSDSQEWRNGKIAGWCETDNNCLVNSDFSDYMFVMQFNIVEVKNAPTP
jgi:hypothetical protein